MLLTKIVVAQTNEHQNHTTCHFSVKGYVVDESTTIPLANVSILVMGLNKGTTTNEKGFFEFTDLCSGMYHIRFSHISCETQNKFFELKKDTTLTIRLAHHDELLHQVEISATPELATQVNSSISEEKIIAQSNKNLADILENIVGVSTIKNGSGISKPVVHGLYGNRVSILNQGIVQAGQQWGNDHAPEIDAFSADYMTVVKGASALQYGGNALGSVIKIESKKISKDPHLHGQTNYIFQSNGRAHTLNAELEKQSKFLAWRIGGTLKKQGDLHTPTYFLTNTGKNEQNLFLKLEKTIAQKLLLNVHYSLFNTEIGILRGSHIGNLTDLEQAIGREEPFFVEDKFSYQINAPRQKVTHHLLKVESEYFLTENSSLEFRYGGQLNQRREFDVRRSGRSDTPSLSLSQQSHFLEGVYIHFLRNNHQVKFGLQHTFINNENNPETGVLPLIPDYEANNSAWFGIFEKKSDELSYQIGGRYEFRNLYAQTISRDLPRRIENFRHYFHNYAFSAGITKRFGEHWDSNIDLGVMRRAPEINELYSFGLHQGVSGIEEGNPNLKEETSLKALWHNDIAISQKFFFQSVVYAQQIQNYMYLQPEQEFRLTIRGAFPLFSYRQTDAFIYGTDFLLTYEPIPNIKLSTKYAIVRGRDRSNEQPLIFMPTDNLSTSLNYAFNEKPKRKNTSISIEGKYVFEQTRLDNEQDFLAPPPAYFLLNMQGKTSLLIKESNLDFTLSIENALNTTYRDYLNRQRYFADDIGISINLGINFRF